MRQSTPASGGPDVLPASIAARTTAARTIVPCTTAAWRTDGCAKGPMGGPGPPVGADAAMSERQVTHVASGKVRDLYGVGDDELLLVASDRLSTYDVVHPTPVPDKGRILTAVSAFWFARLGDLTPHHLLTADPVEVLDGLDVAGAGLDPTWLAGRTLRCRRTEVVPFECVVRGHLAGSGWAEYRSTGAVCGITLPAGLREADALPEPLFTPATKAQQGDHDQNVPFSAMVAQLGAPLAEELRRRSLAIHAAGAAHAASVGLILADTKLEFGLVDDGAGGRELLLIDEVLTPDSSRFWPTDRWAPGGSPPSFDKQYVRDHVTAAGWDRTPPAPELPPDVVAATRARYLEALERLTGRTLDDWWGALEGA
jgi:phosphoribosylaminoimidazole-succinocarboxamide synthase